MSTEYLKWIMPSMKNRSVKNSEFRFEKAMEQAAIAKKMKDENKLPTLDDITDYVKDFLKRIGMKDDVKPKTKKTNRIYSDIWSENKQKGMVEKNDIVWIKVTKNGVIGVIGTSCDIFLDFPNDKEKYSTSDKIVEYVSKEECEGFSWDTERVLIFPLCNIPEGLNRSDIESGIGNYLIHKNVPILDYYSHNY